MSDVLTVIAIACLGSTQGGAGDAIDAADKDRFHLFNPTPRDLMRELSTDRPDTTESPYTVDAGHLQLEMSFVDYVRDGDDDAWTIAPLNLKVGLLNDVDLQFVFDPYITVRNGDDADGVGDTQLRLKWNLWGNDGGDTALALMPYIRFPTASNDLGNDEYEGGLIIPLGMDIGGGWGMGLMAEFDVVYDEADDDHDLELLHTCAFGRDIAGDLGGYVEYIGIARFDGGDYDALLGMGLTYALSADVQLDGGVNLGLTSDASDVNPFVGVSVRF